MARSSGRTPGHAYIVIPFMVSPELDEGPNHARTTKLHSTVKKPQNHNRSHVEGQVKSAIKDPVFSLFPQSSFFAATAAAVRFKMP